jgi:Iron-containing redox enzyme
MTIAGATDTLVNTSTDALTGKVAAYAAHRVFRPGPEIYIDGNPYRRPIGLEGLDGLDFSVPATEEEFLSYRQLVAGRMLCNAYESDMILLPAAGLGSAKDDFDLFYSDEVRRQRDAVRPDLERFAFSFLADSVKLPPVHTLDELQEYFLSEVSIAGSPADGSGVNPAVDSAAPVTGTMKSITECAHAEEAAALNLIQLALDALTEASAMARNLGGSWGAEQSELFKIFIDEFGYGVYTAKHSTIFKDMLASIGLRTDVHAYWNFYLTSSLVGTNYFNYLTEDHRGMFRYMSAVTYLEWLFAQGFANTGAMLRAVFGDRVDTRYCDEHAHIDIHHGRLTYENLLLGFVRTHGELIIPDLVRGIEEIKLLMRLGDEDFLAQIRWADSLDEHTRLGARLATSATDDATDPATDSATSTTSTMRPDDPFSTRVYDTDRLITVTEGDVDVYAWATERPHRLGRGDVLLVPRGRLHGLKAVSPRARLELRGVARHQR